MAVKHQEARSTWNAIGGIEIPFVYLAMAATPFFDFADSIYPLSDECKLYLASVLKTRELSKGDFVLRAEEVCNKIGFIDKGCLKSYSTKAERESNIWFWFAGDVVTSTVSFFEQSPSNNYIQAITATRFHYLTHDVLEYAYKAYPETNILARLLLQKYYALEVKRIELLKGSSAVDRYKFLMEKHPEVLENVTSKDIASYLDVSKFRLSQIRSEIAKSCNS